MTALKYVNKNQYLFLNMLLYKYIDLFKSRQLNVTDKKKTHYIYKRELKLG